MLEQFGDLARAEQELVERQRAQESRRRSEEQLLRALRASRVATWELQISTNEMMWSDSIDAILGFPPGGFAGTIEAYQKMVHPDDFDMLVEALIRAVQQDAPYYVEYRIIWPDDTVRWLLGQGKVFRDARGQAVRMAGTVLDITERKQTTEQIERWFNLSVDMIAIAGIDGYFKQLNPAFEKTLGYSQAELLAKPFLDFIHPDDLPATLAEIEKLAQGVTTIHFENRYRCQDGSYKWLSWRTEPTPQGTLYAIARDITEQKQVEQALRQSKQRLSSLIQQSPMAVIEWDLDFKVIEWSLAAEKIFGYRREEALGRHGSFIVPEEVHPHVDTIFQSLLSQTGGTNSINDNLRASRRLITCQWYNAPLVDPDGKVVGIVSLVEDITEHQQAEEARRASEEQFRLLFELAPIGMTIMTLDGKFLRANQAFCNTVGYTADELLGLTFADLSHPDDVATNIAWHQEIIEDKRPDFQLEKRYISKHGQVIHIILQTIVVQDSAGQPPHVVAQIVDISARKRAEEALRKSKARLRELYSEVQAVASAETEEHARRLALLDEMGRQMNLATKEQEIFDIAVRYSSQLIQADRTSIALLNEARDSFTIAAVHGQKSTVPVGTQFRLAETMIGQAIQDKRLVKVSNLEERLSFQSRNLSAMDISSILVTPIIMGEQVIGTLNVARQRAYNKRDKDLFLHMASFLGITVENMRRNKELQKAKEIAEQARRAAESANRAKSTFLANMSHELRTPLNGILGYAQILRQEKNLSQKQREGLSIIQNSGTHLLTLINDILNLSKIEAQKMELHPTTFHLPQMLDNIVKIIRPRTEEKGISFIYQSLSDLPTGVDADQKRLSQVLMNLLSNAIKFTDQGGVALKVGYHNHKIRFQVEDTGIGIAPQEIADIFKAFQQVGQQSQLIEGTGLGLAISRKLVEMMGSELKVKSQVGEGTIFWLDLDLPEVPNFTPTTQTDERRVIGFKGPPHNVLIVDDHWENRSLLTNMLAPLGFNVREAVDGQDALNKTIEFQPDLILLDLRMPVMHGLEAIRRIRQLPTAQETIIITVSASAFDHDRQKSLSTGSNDFLAKPFRQSNLLRLLHTHLELEWIYDDQTERTKPPQAAKEPPASSSSSSSSAPFIVPPAEELSTLFDLAMKGNIRGIVKQTQKLTQQNQQYHPFATQVRQLAENIQIKEVRKLIKQYMN